MFVALERLLHLHEGYRRTFRIAGRNLLLLIVDNNAVLLENRCPYQGAELQDEKPERVDVALSSARHRVRSVLRSGSEWKLPGIDLVQALS
ncbi:Rieske (2Fe-2S) protein [Azotobacter chroococcum]|uniref:Rieske (2Fe-2S) protein n=1 Tax=Azotobacter chroococcum TaxID=353 RepID=UPI001A954A50|nr:Rieske (2Fe-2S) protein [Azotobacter chroococcum]